MYQATEEERRRALDELIRSVEIRKLRMQMQYSDADGKHRMDTLLRYERLADDFAAFVRSLGIENPPELPHVKKGIMADKLDGQRLEDGRYFQVTPGKHELVVRFDYEIYSGGMMSQPRDRTCYLTVRFDNFKAGERYRLEARAPVMEPQVLLYDASRKVLVNEPSNVFCIP